MLASLGRLYVELGAEEEGVVALEVGAVGGAEGGGAHVVDVAWGADGERQSGGLEVAELGDVAGQDVDERVRDARKHDAFDVAGLLGFFDLGAEPGGEGVVGEIADSDVDAVSKRERALVGDGQPVTRGDDGGDRSQVRVGFGGHAFVKVEGFFGSVVPVLSVPRLLRDVAYEL